MKRVILEGCNGGWAQERYLPVLIEKAVKGEIELWAVDIEPRIKLGASIIAALWQEAQNNGKAHYLDKTRNKDSYDTICNTDYVFIVTPDCYHSEIAEFWLGRLSPKGKVFIEKPLDASVEEARKLGRDLARRDIVYGFDHYLASTYPLLYNKASYQVKIGKIRKIEFHILEPPEISRQREKTLDKGMIFDLFGHVLAVVCAVLSKNLTCSATGLQTVNLEEVKAARYVGCPISGETFACIKAIINSDIEIISLFGKGVGSSEDKFMRLYGSDGNTKLDFAKDEFYIFDRQGRQQKKGRLESRHVESFLDGVIQSKKPLLSVPGVFSFDAALEILKILDKAEKQITAMPEYLCQESINKILERFPSR